MNLTARTTAIGLATLLAGAGPAPAQTTCGPVLVMGLDADDHGPDTTFAGIYDQLLRNVTNGGSGILAIGLDPASAGSGWLDSVSRQMALPQTVTLVNDGDILIQDFAGFALLHVPSDWLDVNGGISEAENALLTTRTADIAMFVNAGGGLVGHTQGTLPDAWDYLAQVARVSTIDVSSAGRLPSGDLFDDVTATPEGVRLGLTDSNVDGCCFHNNFIAFPPYLEVLAVGNQPFDPEFDGEAVFLGGESVCLLPFCGDGMLDPGEQCDDGNVAPDDGCDELCQIELEPPCVRTQGFWKTHHRFANNPSQNRPWPIDENTLLCGATWLEVLYVPPRGDAWFILAHQWIAGMLNVADGARAPAEVKQALAEAEALLLGCVIDPADRGVAIALAELLDDYNNGRLEPCGSGPSTSRRRSTSSSHQRFRGGDR